jgi:DNA-binding CsgD family transcriptional regulator
MIGMHHAFRIQLALIRGDPGEILEDSLATIHRAPPIPLVRVSAVIALAILGDPDRARAELAPLRGAPSRMPLGPRWFGTAGQVAMAAALLGDADTARTCHDLLLPCAPWCGGDGGGSPFASGSNRELLGRLALTYGDRAAAVAHFEGGIAVDDRIGAAPYAALGRLGLAEALAPTDPARARQVAAAAAAELRRLDMPGRTAEAERLLGGLAAARPGGLTERELEVARLVREALTNQQIADRLVLSVRTVESHVRNALTKLGLTSRTELAVWLEERG